MNKLDTAISLMVADDHPVVRAGIKSLIEREADLVVVAEATNGAEAVRLARLREPQVIVMDLQMPVLDGFEATRRIIELLPDTRVIILSAYVSGERLRDAQIAGACGYVAKHTAVNDLVKAIRKAHQKRFFSPRRNSAFVLQAGGAVGKVAVLKETERV